MAAKQEEYSTGSDLDIVCACVGELWVEVVHKEAGLDPVQRARVKRLVDGAMKALGRMTCRHTPHELMAALIGTPPE